MTQDNKPSDKSRRKFLKNISSGIVGTYAVSPSIKLNAESIKSEILNSLESKIKISVNVNGKNYIKAISPETTLAEFLRNELNLTGTKIVCNQGECGSCTVLLDNKPIYSCHFLALDADGKNIITIEGLMKDSELNIIQKVFIEKDGLQCGFCTPGQIITAYSIIINNPKVTDEEIKEGMAGNLCRCGAYPKIFDSVKEAIKQNK